MLAVRAVGDEHLELFGVDAAIAYCLRRIPVILDQRDTASVRERLHPDALPQDAARNAEWHRLVDDELRHLFEAAQRTFATDLERLDAPAGHIVFPVTHLKAWMSAVNQARIVLSAQHGFEAGDMERDEFVAGTPRGAALLQVQLLGVVLQVLVEFALEGP